MTEIEYRELLIDLVRAGDYKDKKELLELLKITSIRFEKTSDYTDHLWNHYKEYIQICIIPDKINELNKHYEYLKKKVYELYPVSDDYELFGVKIKPGAMPDTEDVSQEILFENIRRQIIEKIQAAKYMILISVAWFTDPVLFQELIKKKQQRLIIEICLDDCDKNHDADFSLEEHFPVYWITVQSQFKNIMHEKFCVIDLYTSIHGSYNWTKAANYNKEHICIDKNYSTAATFADEFMRLKNQRTWFK